jgi:predicted MFS family arabinose efflux permease
MASANFVMLGVAALIPLVRHDFAFSNPEIGAVVATPGLTAAIFGLPAARITDELGAGVAVAVSQLFVIAGSVAFALAPDVPVFFAGAGLVGVGYAVLNPATNVLSTGSISARRRGLAMSIKQTGVTVGGAVAGLTLPGIAGGLGWRGAIAIPSAVAAGVAAWGFAIRTRGRREPLVLSDRTIDLSPHRLGLYGFAMAGGQVAIFGYVTVYLVDRAGYSPAVAGIGLALAMTAGSVGRIAWGVVSDRSRDRVRLLQLISIGSALTLVVVPLAGSVATWVVLVLVGVFSAGWNGAFHAVVAESSGVRGVGRATSFALLFLYLGNVLVPPLLGFVIDHLSWSSFWFVEAAGAVVAAVLLRGAVRPTVSTPMEATP